MNQASTRYISLLGLGFGDCGKGLFTDYLSRQLQAHSVVRFNGGAQAGHNVVLPDGRQHTFSQFAAGSFNPGVVTVLSAPVVVHPTAMMVENQYLQALGVLDGLERMMIDARCRVTTPFHQAAGRLRELLRGASAHGSCGVGVGETVAQALAAPDSVLCYGDLISPARAFEKLQVLRERLAREFAASDMGDTPQIQQEIEILRSEDVAERWLQQISPLMARVKPASAEQIAAHLRKPGTVLFEGAQGVLLDEWRGFHPHTTWSTISTSAVEAVLRELGIAESVTHLGLLRSYLTRHGAGPFPTWDRSLDQLAEPHNASAGWQGQFKRGQPDQVLLRYSLEAVGKLDGLLLSHLDVFERGHALRWCEAYQMPADKPSPMRDAHLCERNSAGDCQRLLLGAAQDLSHQAELTALLQAAVPRYAAQNITSAPEFIAQISALTELPVRYASYGPSWHAVRSVGR